MSTEKLYAQSVLKIFIEVKLLLAVTTAGTSSIKTALIHGLLVEETEVALTVELT